MRKVQAGSKEIAQDAGTDIRVRVFLQIRLNGFWGLVSACAQPKQKDDY
jgi:hypothetical protein